MKSYDHKKIEKKWQNFWNKKGIYKAKDPKKDSGQEKFYSLIEFPFPNATGLHIGHIRSNTAMDIISRKRRAEGFNVLYPIGWDAFGLPVENYAIKTGIQPKIVTKKNTDVFRKQLKALGFSFDWSREINTTDPKYYKWTQWLFLQFYKHGLAYKKKMLINWCPKDKIGLANEEVIDGCCERCGTPVEKREKEQWMLAITKYADRLDKDLDTVDYQAKIKIQQRNWIGKSEGAEIEFKLKPEVVPTFYQFFGPAKIHEEEPYVERKAIIALVKHWSEDKYLGLKWKKVDWETLITGGVEGEQTPEEAARTEILQETGYKNLKLVKKLGKMDSRFFHVPKKHNRYGHFDMFYFELENGERQVLSDEEKANHEPVWLSREEILKFNLPSSHRYLWDVYVNDGKPPEYSLKVFTTRPDTIFGATYLVLAPEHPLVSHFIHQASNSVEIHEYILAAKNKTQIDRTADTKEKTGIELKGIKAINPATKEEIPVYIADYVLDSYGTGAVMAVPAHDERDHDFAKKFNLPIKSVLEPITGIARENEETRKSIVAIVKDQKTNKYISINWGVQGGNLFIGGGQSDKEDVVETAIREIQEETGYKNVRFISQTEKIHHHYFAHSKNVARYIEAVGLYFELLDDSKTEQKLEEDEKGKFTIEWLSQQEIEKKITEPLHLYTYNKLIKNKIFVGEGILTNSGSFDGLSSSEAQKIITESVGGNMVTTYKLRDWIFSRQRYWGEPIPMIFCKACEAKNGNGWVPVPEKDLPVKLPNVKKYEPTDNGESPLASIKKWVNVKCPVCKSPAKRETDTMPNWAGSSWYFMRYADPKNSKAFADPEKLKYWQPVNWYNGGMEHTTLHLLYSRFWNKFLFDIGLAPTTEPYMKRTSHGLILAEGGEKMSKSKGNATSPDELVATYGADTLRLYEMFIGPFDQPVTWNSEAIIGPRRFLERVWNLQSKVENTTPPQQGGEEDKNNPPSSARRGLGGGLESSLHKTIKKVSDSIEKMEFNTAVSALMILVNEFDKEKVISKLQYQVLLKLLAPFAPHISEELWSMMGNKKSITLEPWPIYDESKLVDETVRIAVQVDGKLRDEIEVPVDSTEEHVKSLALELPNVKKWLQGREIKKVIYVKNRLVNII